MARKIYGSKQSEATPTKVPATLSHDRGSAIVTLDPVPAGSPVPDQYGIGWHGDGRPIAIGTWQRILEAIASLSQETLQACQIWIQKPPHWLENAGGISEYENLSGQYRVMDSEQLVAFASQIRAGRVEASAESHGTIDR